MQCPQCGDEYEAGVQVCVDCRIPLASPGARAPLQTRHLGRFAEPVGDRVLQLLRAKGINYDFERDGTDGWVIRVDAGWRDDVASDLFSGWTELLHGLERETAYEILALGGSHPGWLDAPTDVWADRHGRLQVAIDPDGDPDHARAIGPALLVFGLALVLLGLAGAISTGLAVTFGLALLVLGALLPR